MYIAQKTDRIKISDNKAASTALTRIEPTEKFGLTQSNYSIRLFNSKNSKI